MKQTAAILLLAAAGVGSAPAIAAELRPLDPGALKVLGLSADAQATQREATQGAPRAPSRPASALVPMAAELPAPGASHVATPTRRVAWATMPEPARPAVTTPTPAPSVMVTTAPLPPMPSAPAPAPARARESSLALAPSSPLPADLPVKSTGSGSTDRGVAVVEPVPAVAVAATPPPAPPPVPTKSFVINAGEMVSEVFRRWLQSDGKQLVWQTESDFRLDVGARFQKADAVDAVQAVAENLGRTHPDLAVRAYANGVVLVTDK